MVFDISRLSLPSLPKNWEKLPPLEVVPEENVAAANTPSAPSKSELSRITSGVQMSPGLLLGLTVGFALGIRLCLELGVTLGLEIGL